jgi:hypothetical protein
VSVVALTVAVAAACTFSTSDGNAGAGAVVVATVVSCFFAQPNSASVRRTVVVVI